MKWLVDILLIPLQIIVFAILLALSPLWVYGFYRYSKHINEMERYESHAETAATISDIRTGRLIRGRR